MIRNYLLQAYKNIENTFLSPINFNDKIIATNVNINKLYQGVNMSQLLNNLTRFIAFNNYNKNYADMFDVVTKIRSSLQCKCYILFFLITDYVFFVKLKHII